MVPEQSSQAVNRDSNAVSMDTTTTTSSPLPPPPTQQPPQQQIPGTQQQQPQMQGQFQPAYFQQYPGAYGQPFQPYNPQALPQGQFQQPTAGQFQQYQQFQQQQQHPAYVANAVKAWVLTRIALHAADIICCIVAIGISFHVGTFSETGYIFTLCTPIFFLALVWDLAEIITWFCRKRKAGIHPGAHVGVSLIIWLGAAIVGGIQAAFVAYVVNDSSDCWDYESQSYESCTSSSSYDGQAGLFTAVAVFSCLVWLIHFTLFINGCIETARRNRANRRVVTVVAPPYWGPMAHGWQPMPQYYAQTPQSQGQNTTVPQHNIPLQIRSPTEQQQTGNGKQPEQPIVNDKQGESSTQPANPAITEYYTPSGR